MHGISANAFQGPERDKSLLGSLGQELAHVYHGTLHASLPASLQALVDKLDQAERDGGARSRNAAGAG